MCTAGQYTHTLEVLDVIIIFFFLTFRERETLFQLYYEWHRYIKRFMQLVFSRTKRSTHKRPLLLLFFFVTPPAPYIFVCAFIFTSRQMGFFSVYFYISFSFEIPFITAAAASKSCDIRYTS